MKIVNIPESDFDLNGPVFEIIIFVHRDLASTTNLLKIE